MLSNISGTTKLTKVRFGLPITSLLNARLLVFQKKNFGNTYLEGPNNTLSRLSSCSRFPNITHFQRCTLYNQTFPYNKFGRCNFSFIGINISNYSNNNRWRLLNGLVGLRQLWEKYGYISIFTYFTIYIFTFTSFWILTINDVINAAKIKKVISILRLDNHINSSKFEQKIETPFGRLFLAWISTKIVEPLRLFSTIALTPYIYKMFRR